jgi:PEP-CTERM motif
MRRGLIVALFALLCVSGAKADTVGPSWDITAAGIFSGGGPQSEAFAFNWTLTFQSISGSPGMVTPVWTGVASFTGVLGTFTDHFTEFTNPADGGFVSFTDPHGDEIDVLVSDYTGIPSSQMSQKPTLGVPYLYSCNVASVCQAYGTTVGFGLFSGSGTIIQNAHDDPAATPEPSTLLLLLIGAGACAITMARRQRDAARVALH